MKKKNAILGWLVTVSNILFPDLFMSRYPPQRPPGLPQHAYMPVMGFNMDPGVPVRPPPQASPSVPSPHLVYVTPPGQHGASPPGQYVYYQPGISSARRNIEETMPSPSPNFAPDTTTPKSDTETPNSPLAVKLPAESSKNVYLKLSQSDLSRPEFQKFLSASKTELKFEDEQVVNEPDGEVGTVGQKAVVKKESSNKKTSNKKSGTVTKAATTTTRSNEQVSASPGRATTVTSTSRPEHVVPPGMRLVAPGAIPSNLQV